jgi:hypothetical protein
MATQFAFGKMATNGLVLALDAADKNSYPGSGTTWYDVSGNNNHITLTNGPTFDNSSIKSISFDGVDDFGTADSNASLTMSQPTLLVVSTVGGLNSTVLAKGGSGANWNYGLRVRGSTTNFYARNNNNDTLSPTFPVSLSTFNIYGLVWTGSTVKFFRNGVYGGDNSDFYSPRTNSLFLRIGCAWNHLTQTNVEFFQGKIASIYIYNRALSDSEMILNQNNLKSRFNL